MTHREAFPSPLAHLFLTRDPLGRVSEITAAAYARYMT